MKKLFLLIVIMGAFLIPAASSKARPLYVLEIENFDINYELGRDQDNHSTLKTTEKITANFTNPKTNHGIERFIPEGYDNHSTYLRIISVTDTNNNPLQYSTYKSNSNTVVRIGDPNKYVLGKVTYVITYTQKEVTKYFKDSGMDEWYWDTNGTGWTVPINSLNIQANINESLSGALSDQNACYQGPERSTTKCQISKKGGIYTVNASNLEPGENVSLAIGFKPNTFAAHKTTLLEKYLTLVLILNFIAPVIVIPFLIVSGLMYSKRNNRSSERKTIITEFIPPKNTSVSVSAEVLNAKNKVMASQILDLAVRHFIKIYEIKKTSFFGKDDYEIEIIKNVNELKTEELEVLLDIYSKVPEEGDRISLSSISKNYFVTKNLADNSKKVRDLNIDTYMLRGKNPDKSSWFKRSGIVFLILALPILNIFFLILGLILIIMGVALKPLTDRGLVLARYLDGLKQYIKVAEVDRIKALQSPEGAEKVGSVDPNDKAQLIKLYERVLPYAVLFGLEKSWSKQIGDYYEATNTSPIWYVGTTPGFNAVVFADSINKFNSQTSVSTSSSTGGASGGGFSGGGGGGGGGGGW